MLCKISSLKMSVLLFSQLLLIKLLCFVCFWCVLYCLIWTYTLFDKFSQNDSRTLQVLKKLFAFEWVKYKIRVFLFINSRVNIFYLVWENFFLCFDRSCLQHKINCSFYYFHCQYEEPRRYEKLSFMIGVTRK